MKKIILTFLGVLFLTVTASAQFAPATIENKTDCSFRIEFTYADETCTNFFTSPSPMNIPPGGTFTPTVPPSGGNGNERYIVSASVTGY